MMVVDPPPPASRFRQGRGGGGRVALLPPPGATDSGAGTEGPPLSLCLDGTVGHTQDLQPAWKEGTPHRQGAALSGQKGVAVRSSHSMLLQVAATNGWTDFSPVARAKGGELGEAMPPSLGSRQAECWCLPLLPLWCAESGAEDLGA